MNVYDVPSDKLLDALAGQVKKLPGLEAPEWAQFVKTGSHAERPPHQPDWWFARAASIMRKLYLRGPIGVGDLKRGYGGSKAVAYFPKHHRDAGTSAIRKIIKQLELAELVAKTPKGRVLTPKGTAMLDKLSKEIFTELSKENKALARYG
ncbi:MAG: 30S ribosomal protein S19e [Nitrososphaerales archaeon]|nr:30S ribosomal protein S19e [Nitrososphaerales archaeon]